MNLFSKALLASATLFISAQAIEAGAPPKLMILPSKVWCVDKGYYTETERNGKVRQTEDFDKAFLDKDYNNVRLAIAQIMAERNFPVVDAAAQQEADDEDEMLDEAYEGAQTGAGVQTNAYDEIIKRAKPDITLRIGWDGTYSGSLYNCNIQIEAIDTYSNKSVAPLAGQTGEVRRTVPLAVALKQAVRDNMDDFCGKLMTYFDDLQTNGREIRLDVRIIDNGAGTTMNTEYDGVELKDIIYNWVSDNTVNHVCNQRSSGRNMQRYDQVRIPLHDSNGRPLTAERWAKDLQTKLKSLGLPAENTSSGLGAGRIYIGEK